MPTDLRPSIVARMTTVGKWRDGARWLCLGWGAVVAIHVALVSLDRATYFADRESLRHEWSHPTDTVAAMVVLTVVEAAALHVCLGLNRAALSRTRVAAALLLLIPWGLILTAGVIHAPGFYIVHVAWVWFLIGILLIALTLWFLAAGIAHLRSARGGRSQA